MEDLKDTPYNRLKTILKSEDEPELTKKGSDNINKLLDVEEKPTLWDKILKKLKKFDNWLFPKSKITNTYQKRNRN